MLTDEQDRLSISAPSSVEAALAQPGRGMGTSALDALAPTQATSSAMSTQGHSAVAPGETDLDALAPKVAQVAPVAPRNAMGADALAPIVDAARNGAQARRASKDATTEVGDNALTRLIKSLRGSENPPAAAPSATAQVQPVAPAAPQPPLPPITMGKSALGRGEAPGYEYGGMRVELPRSVNVRDMGAVRNYMEATNKFIDWMNEEED